MAAKIWVRGIPGRLTRIEPGGDYLRTDVWTPATETHFILRKHRAKDLELSYTDPTPRPVPPAPKVAAPAASALPKEA